MAESPKPIDSVAGLLDLLGRYSRRDRLLVLLVVIPCVLVGAHVYAWPGHWPTKVYWYNIVLAAVIIIVILYLVLIKPDPQESVDELPETAPVMDGSLKYFKLPRELRRVRKQLIQEIDFGKTGQNALSLSDDQQLKCAISRWEYDRIALYLFERYTARPEIEKRMKRVEKEAQILDTWGWRSSRVPLHYALESVQALFVEGRPPSLTGPQAELIGEIRDRFNHWRARVRRRLHREVEGKRIITMCEVILGRSSLTDHPKSSR